jgi:hypothetical protein
MIETLSAAAQGARQAPVAEVVRLAQERFGQADAHDVEAAFDELVMRLAGSRGGDPPGYVLPR